MASLPTILAVSSPPGASARGIVRISGAEARAVVGPHLDRDAAGRRGAWVDRLAVDRLDLPVLVLGFPAPRSFTGEDVLELQMPGHPALLERVIEGLLTSAGDRGCDARRAEAGEFTARAFMNGRLSLVQAEGVAATIAARSDAELAAAAWLRNGALGRLASTLADELAGTLSLVEAGIDFTDEEDVVPVTAPIVHDRVSAWIAQLDERLARAVGAEQLEAIPWVVLTGPPNAGKSTLFNALLGHERAVVSAVAGTTRDVLVEPLAITTAHGPAEVMLVDLAGLTGSGDAIDRLMQDAAEQARRRADLRIHCVAIDMDAAALEPRPVGPTLEVRTKADLDPSPERGREPLVVSARREADLVALRAAIADRLADRTVSLGADAVVLRPRHEAALRSARDELARALDLVENDADRRILRHPELVAAGLRQALDELASLAGAVTPDDILGRIFAEFCIGK